MVGKNRPLFASTLWSPCTQVFRSGSTGPLDRQIHTLMRGGRPVKRLVWRPVAIGPAKLREAEYQAALWRLLRLRKEYLAPRTQGHSMNACIRTCSTLASVAQTCSAGPRLLLSIWDEPQTYRAGLRYAPLKSESQKVTSHGRSRKSLRAAFPLAC